MDACLEDVTEHWTTSVFPSTSVYITDANRETEKTCKWLALYFLQPSSKNPKTNAVFEKHSEEREAFSGAAGFRMNWNYTVYAQR